MDRTATTRWILVAAAALGLAALAYLDLRPTPGPGVGRPHPAHAAEPAPARTAVPNSSAMARAARSSRTAVPTAADYPCAALKPVCDHDPLVAGSEAEAGWLRTFGYPTPGQVREMQGLGLAELQRRADAGDRVAEVFLGNALLAAGEGRRGQGRLFNSLVEGSTYAAYATADAYGPDARRPSRIERAAHLRLAYLLGAGKVLCALARATEDFDTVERVRADERAMRLYANLLEERARSGRPMRLAPRPTGL